MRRQLSDHLLRSFKQIDLFSMNCHLTVLKRHVDCQVSQSLFALLDQTNNIDQEIVSPQQTQQLLCSLIDTENNSKLFSDAVTRNYFLMAVSSTVALLSRTASDGSESIDSFLQATPVPNTLIRYSPLRLLELFANDDDDHLVAILDSFLQLYQMLTTKINSHCLCDVDSINNKYKHLLLHFHIHQFNPISMFNAFSKFLCNDDSGKYETNKTLIIFFNLIFLKKIK